MTIENTIGVLTFLMSVIALFFAFRKQRHDEYNADADTINKLMESFRIQEERYNALKLEFENYKKSMNLQFADISSENIKLRNWARRLCAQLEAHNVVPTKFEDSN